MSVIVYKLLTGLEVVNVIDYQQLEAKLEDCERISAVRYNKAVEWQQERDAALARVAEVEKGRSQFDLWNMESRALLRAAEAREASLREALEWYANLIACDSFGNLIDCGKRAKVALEAAKEPNA